MVNTQSDKIESNLYNMLLSILSDLVFTNLMDFSPILTATSRHVFWIWGNLFCVNWHIICLTKPLYFILRLQETDQPLPKGTNLYFYYKFDGPINCSFRFSHNLVIFFWVRTHLFLFGLTMEILLATHRLGATLCTLKTLHFSQGYKIEMYCEYSCFKWTLSKTV